MSEFIARLGDTGSHGGSILSASPKIKVDGIFVARHGDSYFCNIHGMQTLISGAKTKADGISIVRVGDSASCGSVIINGSLKTKAN